MSETEPKITRRDFMKSGFLWGTGLLGLAAAGTGYMTGIEPRWIETVHNRLEIPGLPSSFRGLKIAHFSDLHYGYHYGLNRLKSLVQRVMSESPDLILFTGDLVEFSAYESGKEISQALLGLKAPYGQFAVLGNHDYFVNVNVVEKALNRGGFRCLRNKSALVKKDGASIRIAGIEDMRRGMPNLEEALYGVRQDEVVMLMSHCPDMAQVALMYPVQVQFSGHSHGGQVRLPFIGPLKRVPGAELFPDGLVRLEDGKLQLYTNRGIGMTGLPIRFMCRPELTIHTLESRFS